MNRNRLEMIRLIFGLFLYINYQKADFCRRFKWTVLEIFGIVKLSKLQPEFNYE